MPETSKAKDLSYEIINKSEIEFSPCKRAEQKRSNDRPAGNCRRSDSGIIKEIHQAHPRHSSPDKNCQEYSETEIV